MPPKLVTFSHLFPTSLSVLLTQDRNASQDVFHECQLKKKILIQAFDKASTNLLV